MARGTIDNTGLKIIKLLQDGRKSYKDIGAAIGLSEATVRSKVNKLVQDGLIEIKALVSTKDMDVGYQLAYVGVRLNSPALKKTAEAISELPGVISVALVTGRFDLILTIMLTPDFELMDFFNAMMERHSGDISLNETFMVYESVNCKMPFPY